MESGIAQGGRFSCQVSAGFALLNWRERAVPPSCRALLCQFAGSQGSSRPVRSPSEALGPDQPDWRRWGGSCPRRLTESGGSATSFLNCWELASFQHSSEPAAEYKEQPAICLVITARSEAWIVSLVPASLLVKWRGQASVAGICSHVQSFCLLSLFHALNLQSCY